MKHQWQVKSHELPEHRHAMDGDKGVQVANGQL